MNNRSKFPAEQASPESAIALGQSDLTRGLQLADSLELAGKLDQAESLYRGLLQAHPQHAVLLHHLGLLLRERGQLAEAEAVLLRAIAADPGDSNIHNSLGTILHTQGRLDAAQECYGVALQLRGDYAEAHYNLGVLLEEMGRTDEALAEYRAAVVAQPRYARALTRIGVILEQQGAVTEALAELDQAVAASPHFFDAQYYRGGILSGLRRHEEALAALKRASSLRPDNFDAVLATANALRDAMRHDEALTEYWRALELQPERAATHEELNRLAWSTGRRDLYLRSFAYARQRFGSSPDLYALEAAFRLRRDEFVQAEELLWPAQAHAPDRGDIHGLLARALAGQGRFEEAYAFFDRAIAAEPQIMLHRHQLGFTLLRDGQASEALRVFEQALVLDPVNQLLLAGQALAYRELDDSRYQTLVDLSRYVRTYQIAPPAGFADSGAFNRALAQELDALHTTRVAPIDQPLRGGTQTSGQLFAAGTPLIQELRNAIREAVADYIRDLPQDPAHPMSLRNAADFDFIGSWSCRLGSQGYHTNHVHPMGWISSAYYARLPEDIDDARQRPGWLKFGESNLALGQRDRPDSFVQPAVGRLVLFPSFYWHGTTAFSDRNDRLGVAFDVVPGVVSGSGGGHGRT